MNTKVFISKKKKCSQQKSTDFLTTKKGFEKYSDHRQPVLTISLSLYLPLVPQIFHCTICKCTQIFGGLSLNIYFKCVNCACTQVVEQCVIFFPLCFIFSKFLKMSKYFQLEKISKQLNECPLSTLLLPLAAVFPSDLFSVLPFLIPEVWLPALLANSVTFF